MEGAVGISRDSQRHVKRGTDPFNGHEDFQYSNRVFQRLLAIEREDDRTNNVQRYWIFARARR